MRIVVLGAAGMLGRKVCAQLFEDGHDVMPVTRAQADLRNRPQVLGAARGFDWIVNCAGVVKSRDDQPLDMVTMNAAMPHWLEETDARVLHVSTDCVFDGKVGRYSEAVEPSPVDLYGATKLAGELHGPRSVTLRTSFIGWERGTERGLLAWFVKQAKEGNRVHGYTNALWSGLTAQQVALGISRAIGQRIAPGLYHLSGETISKHDLLCVLRARLGLKIEIIPLAAPIIDRSLNGSLFRERFGFRPPTWGTMAADLAIEAQ